MEKSDVGGASTLDTRRNRFPGSIAALLPSDWHQRASTAEDRRLLVPTLHLL